MKFVYGQKWFPHIIPKPEEKNLSKRMRTPCLLKDDSVSSVRNCFIVSRELSAGRLYSAFYDDIQFFNHLQKYPKNIWNFHEVILGNNLQKPRFDVDIKKDKIKDYDGSVSLNEFMEHLGKSLIDELIDIILKLFDAWGIRISLNKDILIYSSHGKNIQSYHLVIHHFFHINHKEAGAFFQLVANQMGERSTYLDHGVYKSLQNFRLVFSHKVDDFRTKTFQKEFLYKGETITHEYDEDPINEYFQIFKESLVTRPYDSKPLPPLYTEPEKTFESVEISSETVDTSIKVISKGFANENVEFPFKIREIKGSMICLQRIAPSMCPVCRRYHEHDNAFLIIHSDLIRFYCFRDNTRSSPINIPLYSPTLPVPKVEVKVEIKKEELRKEIRRKKPVLLNKF